MDKYDLGIIRSDLDAAFRELNGMEAHLFRVRDHLIQGARELAFLRGDEADKAAAEISKARTSATFVEARADNLRRSIGHIHDRLNASPAPEAVG